MDILVTNDDGIQADGIRALAEALAPLGTISICCVTICCGGTSVSAPFSSAVNVPESAPVSRYFPFGLPITQSRAHLLCTAKSSE